MKEYQLQKAIIDYIKLQYPNLLYCASLGGQYQKYHSQRNKAKATGYRKGFPDLAILEPIETTESYVNFYFGLFLEIKTKKGKPTKEQLWWRDELNLRHYCCRIVYGFDEALEVINRYLEGKISES